MQTDKFKLMHIDFSLPFHDPILVFSIILFIILLTPLLLDKIKVPQIIGLIIAGIIVGPNGFNLLMRNDSVVLFGTVGLLYIMFLSGLEIDLNEFKKNKYKSAVFGAYTFFIPMILGTTIFYFILDYSLISSTLIASMFASHTLLTYPIISKFGITKNLMVNITVGGTVITDTAALLILAVIAGSVTGKLTTFYWIQLIVSILIFASIVLFLFPMIARWFFKKIHDSILQYIFVLALLFSAAFLAQLAGIEGIIGAFLAGLALNRLIPRTSPLMNRLEFVGNALFIPFFLIGVGMLIDYKVLFGGLNSLIIAFAMTVIALAGKYLAAYFTQKTFKFTKHDRLLIFGLSNSQAAATLAAVLIGYKIILGQDANGEDIRLLGAEILNGTIVMILITCTISSFATQKAAIVIAKSDLLKSTDSNTLIIDNTLIGLAKESTIGCLMQLAMSSVDKKKNNELYGLHIITAEKESPETINRAQKLVDSAHKFAASADFKFHPVIRYDLNISSGIINTVKEKNIRHFYIGLHDKSSLMDTFFGNLTRDLLSKNDSAIYIYKSTQPLNTIKKFVVLIPENAELEHGFIEWYQRITQVAINTGNHMKIFANLATIDYLNKLRHKKSSIEFSQFDDFEDFLVIARDVIKDTMLIVGLARKTGISFQPSMDKIGNYLKKYFNDSNFLLVYPHNFGKTNEINIYENTIEHNNNYKSIKNNINAKFE